jgi:hypothetical protein
VGIVGPSVCPVIDNYERISIKLGIGIYIKSYGANLIFNHISKNKPKCVSSLIKIYKFNEITTLQLQ